MEQPTDAAEEAQRFYKVPVIGPGHPNIVEEDGVTFKNLYPSEFLLIYGVVGGVHWLLESSLHARGGIEMARLLAGLAGVVITVNLGHCQDASFPVMRAYKTETPPEIDGLIGTGEWDAAGPPIAVIPEEDVGSAFPEDPYGGPDDLSFQYRIMWAEPWTAYFLFEVTDDIAMEESPGNAWERDQIELFFDGDDLEGSSDLPTFQWWDNTETYGKFGASRVPGLFEGNAPAMTENVDDLFPDGFGAFAAAQVTETGNNADYIVEYAVSLEPMFDGGTFEGTPTADAGQIVPESTAIKWRVCISDDDNFGQDPLGRSHTVCTHGIPDWRDTSVFADLLFVGPFEGVGVPGDFNGDGTLDLADFTILANNFNTEGTHEQGDINFDRQIDLRDFLQFRALFVETQNGGVAAVPEPDCIALLLFTLLPWSMTRKARKSRRDGSQ